MPADAPPELFGNNYDQMANNLLPVILLTGTIGGVRARAGVQDQYRGGMSSPVVMVVFS